MLFQFLDLNEIKCKIQFISCTSHIGLGATVLNSAGLGSSVVVFFHSVA